MSVDLCQAHDIVLQKKLANVITEDKEDSIYTGQAVYI